MGGVKMKNGLPIGSFHCPMDLTQNCTPGTSHVSPEGVRVVTMNPVSGPGADRTDIVSAIRVAGPEATGLVINKLTPWITNVH